MHFQCIIVLFTQHSSLMEISIMLVPLFTNKKTEDRANITQFWASTYKPGGHSLNLVETHAWVVGSIPHGGCAEGSKLMILIIDVSISPSLFLSEISEIIYFFKYCDLLGWGEICPP